MRDEQGLDFSVIGDDVVVRATGAMSPDSVRDLLNTYHYKEWRQAQDDSAKARFKNRIVVDEQAARKEMDEVEELLKHLTFSSYGSRKIKFSHYTQVKETPNGELEVTLHAGMGDEFIAKALHINVIE